MSRAKTFAINLTLIILSLVIVLGILEAALTITKFNSPDASRFVPNKGVTYIPHAYYRHTKEGFSEGYFNSHGFRDYERTYEKPPDVFRILILGDSYTEALQVQLHESFPAVLEKKLNAYGPGKFEVLALGQSGFGTADEYVRYLNIGVAYNPDLVVLAFLSGNDFRDNSKLLNPESLGVRFYYVFDNNHNLVLDRSAVDAYENNLSYFKQIYQKIKANSHLLSLISERIYLYRYQEARKEEARVKDAKSKALGQFSELNIYQTDLPRPWKEAIEITKGIILSFKKSVEEHGSRFMLLSLSNAEQVHPEIGCHLKEQYNVVLDYEQPDRILQEFTRKHKIMFLNLMPAFRDHHAKTGKYLHGFGSSHQGHWNQAGHRLAAALIYEYLKDQNIVPLESKPS
jgi:lysophospholipase L1-like esterase